MERILFGGQGDKGPFGEVAQWCRRLDLETAFFNPRYSVRWPVSSARYKAQCGEDVDFTLAALEYAMRRRQFARPFYINPESSFRNRLRGVAMKAEKMLRAFKPDAMVLYHGYTPVSQILLAKAAKMNIPALFFEPPIVPGGSFILDPLAPFFSTGEVSFLEKTWPPAPLSAAQEKHTQAFIQDWQARRESKYYVADEAEAEQKLADFLGKDKKPVALFALQVPPDMNVAFSLPEGFQGDYQNWVQAMLAQIPPEWKCIIRPHPKSNFIPTPPDAERFLVLPELNLHLLMERADCVITLASNVGMEAILAGRPAIVSNKVFYARKELTLDCAQPAELPALLDRVRGFKIPKKTRLQFVHQALLEYHFFPGEEEKLRTRLAMAKVHQREGEAPLFHILPAFHKALYRLFVAYAAAKRKHLPHAAALAEARAAVPELDWRDAFAPSAVEVLRAYLRRRLLVWRNHLPRFLRG